MCLYTPPCCTPPCTFVCPLYICMPPIHSYAPWGCTPPRGPTCFCAPAWFWHIACCGGVVFLFYVYWDTPPLFGVPPPFYTPHTPLLVLCALLFSGISVLMWAFSPSIEGFGCSPITGGGWGDTSVAVHMLILLHLFL